jgi:hypothetical protein
MQPAPRHQAEGAWASAQKTGQPGQVQSKDRESMAGGLIQTACTP